jgi:hypothetical protein
MICLNLSHLHLISAERSYDKEKYREMLLEAAESILGYFGFDRTFYGDRRKTGSGSMF